MKNLAVLFMLFVHMCLPTAAQTVGGKWAIGFSGGLNTWINDFNTRVSSGGGNLFFRYGFSNVFSLGLLTGYEDLKSIQSPVENPSSPPYLRVQAIPAALTFWFHLAPDNPFTPYLYLGGGVLYYQRTDGGGNYVPDNTVRSSFVVPVGFGLEAYPVRKISMSLDFGFRLTDDRLDDIEFNRQDSYASARVGFNFYLGSDDSEDPDDDQLNNGEERNVGTNPENPDTDGDGLRDGEEVRRYRSNPLSKDSDDDTLTDGDEVMKHRTEPSQADTDGDGLTDGQEVKDGTSPLRMDTDGDALVDGDEVKKHGSNPLKVDSDDDGLSDWDEIKVFNTSPANSDTDGDKLADGEEVKVYRTNPSAADTDGGSVDDGTEVKRKSNPLDPTDDAPKPALRLERGKTVILTGVNFRTGSASLTGESEYILERAYQALVMDTTLKVDIIGHTDNTGAALANLRLSERRAEAVKFWLIRRGVQAGRLFHDGRGEEEPLVSNATTDGRAQNRRVEFRVRK